MASKICMNELCRTTSSYEWKNGWTLKYGGLATLCQPCGIAYENLVFCDTFHLELDGWIECRICGKRIHLGCIASRMLHEYLDLGGVSCISCTKRLESRSIRPLQIPGDVQPASVNGMENRMLDKDGILQMVKSLDVNGPRHLCVSHKEETTASLGQMKGKETIRCSKVNERFTNFSQHPLGSSMFVSPDQSRSKQGVKDVYESLAQPSLNFSLSTPVISSSSIVPLPSGGAEASDQGQKVRQILPKPPKPVPTTSSEMNTEMIGGKIRIARPPAEGRGRHQLLPRYWPRITDQEIQQISGDLKATIAPLFEKVLSASDAGRIGRLVLPKACAEAYFPTINQSEGMPIRIQDVKGKEWTFQFRFWPNNNSRMYVLEGVTPCIQNMQLQAGDTVTFSRLEPSGQLVMGFRKAKNNGDMQEAQTPVLPNGGGSGEASVSGASDNMVTNGSRNSEEKKKARNIGLKNKRLLMNSDDATELRVTWDEAQELMRPHPNAKPKVVMIEDCEIEEYDEPPIFGKKTVLNALASGEQQQWAKCDNCSKWRKLPVDVFLPAKWTCADNVWDLNRCLCSAPEEISPGELEAISQANKDGKKPKMGETNRAAEDSEPTGLDALATAATLDNIGSLAEPSLGATTRHPRHRPGCSCIVCIQPPSGKGKHPPNCKCNVCSTVKRRFKTLMMRKKKRQSEREAAEMAQLGKEQSLPNPMSEVAAGDTLVQVHQLDNGRQMEVGESSMGQLDLNSHPGREDDMLAEATAGLNLATLMNAASLPFEMYLEQNGLSNLSCLLSNNGDGESPLPDEAEEEAGKKDDEDEDDEE